MGRRKDVGRCQGAIDHEAFGSTSKIVDQFGRGLFKRMSSPHRRQLAGVIKESMSGKIHHTRFVLVEFHGCLN